MILESRIGFGVRAGPFFFRVSALGLDLDGGVAEWLKAAVLKTAIPETVSRVRISPPPQKFFKQEDASDIYGQFLEGLANWKIKDDESGKFLKQDLKEKAKIA